MHRGKNPGTNQRYWALYSLWTQRQIQKAQNTGEDEINMTVLRVDRRTSYCEFELIGRLLAPWDKWNKEWKLFLRLVENKIISNRWITRCILFIYLFIWMYAFTTAAYVYLTVHSQTVQRYGKKIYKQNISNKEK